MHETILEELYKTFPLKERQGTGGMRFKYIPNENVIDRMNQVFKGDWSTEVTHKEIIEDQLLIEVVVTVLNPDNGMLFSHTGFSSQPIARYKGAVNTDKIVDIGNIYKSALAKAIVNACTRWGLGLFKEANVYNVDEINSEVPPVVTTQAPPPLPPINPAPVSVSAVNISPPVPVNVPTPAPVPNIPVIPTQKVVTNSTTLTQTIPQIPVNAQAPAAAVLPTIPAPNPELVTAAQHTTPPPVVPTPVAAPAAAPIVNAAIPQLPLVNTSPSTPAVPFATQPTGETNISDVQCVALNGILDMQGIEYEVLATEAFQEKGISKAVPTKEKLNYDDAVVIIKYGNDKFRKR